MSAKKPFSGKDVPMRPRLGQWLRLSGNFLALNRSERTADHSATANTYSLQLSSRIGQFNRSHAAGFSLVEVLIALAIFSAAAIALTGAFVNALLLRERGLGQRSFDSDLGLVRMQLLLQPDRDLAEDGDIYETNELGEAIWSAEIEETEIVDLFKVQFWVEFSDAPENMPTRHEETLYLLRPTWSISDERSTLLEDKKQALIDSRGY